MQKQKMHKSGKSCWGKEKMKIKKEKMKNMKIIQKKTLK